MSTSTRFYMVFIPVLLLLSVAMFVLVLAFLPDMLTAPNPTPTLRWGGDQCSFSPVPPCLNYWSEK